VQTGITAELEITISDDAAKHAIKSSRTRMILEHLAELLFGVERLQ